MRDRFEAAVAVAAGPLDGLGHLRRSLALARALRDEGAHVRFLISGPAAAVDLVTRARFEVRSVPSQVDQIAHYTREGGARILVVDSYHLTSGDLARLQDTATLFVVIDDLADRVIPADIVINPGAGAESLAYDHARVQLLGPRYCLLAPEYAAATPSPIAAEVVSVLVTAGGGSAGRVVATVTQAVLDAVTPARVNVLVGPFGEHEERLPDRAHVLRSPAPDVLLAIQRDADLVVTAGGQTMYECAALGRPIVAFETAANQRLGLRAMAAAGAVVYADIVTDRGRDLTSVVSAVVANPSQRMALAERARAVVAPSGASHAASRIVSVLRE